MELRQQPLDFKGTAIETAAPAAAPQTVQSIPEEEPNPYVIAVMWNILNRNYHLGRGYNLEKIAGIIRNYESSGNKIRTGEEAWRSGFDVLVWQEKFGLKNKSYSICFRIKGNSLRAHFFNEKTRKPSKNSLKHFGPFEISENAANQALKSYKSHIKYLLDSHPATPG